MSRGERRGLRREQQRPSKRIDGGILFFPFSLSLSFHNASGGSTPLHNIPVVDQRDDAKASVLCGIHAISAKKKWFIDLLLLSVAMNTISQQVEKQKNKTNNNF